MWLSLTLLPLAALVHAQVLPMTQWTALQAFYDKIGCDPTNTFWCRRFAATAACTTSCRHSNVLLRELCEST
jgi:hypothetical protein